jgi:hypothetical protein
VLKPIFVYNSGLLLKMSDPRVNGIDKNNALGSGPAGIQEFVNPAPVRSFALRMMRFHTRNRFSVIAYQYRGTGEM